MDLSLYLQIESVVLPNLKNFDKAVQVAVLAFPQGTLFFKECSDISTTMIIFIPTKFCHHKSYLYSKTLVHGFWQRL